MRAQSRDVSERYIKNKQIKQKEQRLNNSILDPNAPLVSELVPQNAETIRAEHTYKCSNCGKISYNEQEFPRSFSYLNTALDFHLPICKDCINALFEKLKRDGEYKDDKEVIKRICMAYNIYYCDKLANTTLKNSTIGTRMSYYISKATLNSFSGKTYEDTIREERAIQEEQEEENKKIKSKEDLFGTGVSEEAYNFWGFGFLPEEIYFLDNKFVEWTTSHECKTKAQESYFQKICMIELQILKINQSGGDASKLYDQFNKLMNSANLQPKQTTDNTLTEANTFGTLIKKWENEKPISKPAPEWEDVDNIKKYITVWFLGHLAKMVGIQNKWSKLWDDYCEKEVEKWTVTPPTFDDEDTPTVSFEDIYN